MFSGPNKIGKFTLANLFSKSILCKSKEKLPCEKCDCCLQINKNISSDYIIVDKEADKKNISIKQIRDLQQKLSLKSFETNHKIVIINNSEHLSEEASNALLKTLEEPYSKIIFVMITNQIDTVMTTIKSRCQILKFNNLPNFKIQNWLISKNIDKKMANLICGISNGRPGIAKDYLENDQLLSSHIEKSKKLLLLMQANTISEKLSLITEYLNKSFTSHEIISLLDDWEVVFRDIILIKMKNRNISNINLMSTLKKISSIYGFDKIINLHNLFNKSKQLIINSVNNKLVLENLILNI